jgi:peptidoglycan hydrolase-like protein with peptidoglycan-binding domain
MHLMRFLSTTGTSELKVRRMSRVTAIEIARMVARISTAWLAIAVLAFAVTASPAEAGKKQKKAQPEVTDVDNGEPMTLVVSTGQQKIDVYRGTDLVASSVVSTGMAAHPTLIGAFSIIEKQRWHHSNIYSGAPMPWMNRITWSGTALHAGVVPGYPASHGCIRLLYSFAPKLYAMTSKGDNVITSRGRPKPVLIEHDALFQPLPPPPLPNLAEEHQTLAEPTSSPLPAVASDEPATVILAKAEVHTTLDGEAGVPEAAKESQSEPEHSLATTDADADPNRMHAINPDAGPGPASHGSQAAVEAASRDEAKAETVQETVSQEPARDAGPPPPAPTRTPTRVPPPVLAKVDAGIAAAATEAAEPRSGAPLRILFTRRTNRDRIIGMQKIFAEMGYLPELNFDGTIGKITVRAIKAFQNANGMPETGVFNDALVKKVYEVAGKDEPPAGHLFVRQEFDDVFDAPVDFRNPEEPLGTHVYTALNFAPGDRKIRWTVIDVDDNGGDGSGALDRLEMPSDIRQKISERLTPGSTFIVADTSINSAGLPKGGDFVVLAKGTSKAKVSNTDDDTPKVRQKPRRNTADRRYNYDYRYRSAPWFARPW